MKKLQRLKFLLEQDDMVLEKDVEACIPDELYGDWENYMRGKTCPLNDEGERGVYSWDLQQFVERFT